MAKRRRTRTRAIRSPRRRAVAAALGGVLGLQLALATPAGAMAFGAGAMAFGAGGPPAAMSGPADAHEASPAGPEPIAEPSLGPSEPATGPSEPAPMPCGDAGHCGWGLMRCDAAGSCGLPQILPVERPPSPGTASTSTPRPVSLTAPVTVSPAVELPPPRA